MAPAEVHEPVHVLLVVVDDALHRVERHSEAGARAVDVEVDYVAIGRDVLDLAESEQVLAVVMKVLHAVSRRVEHHGLAPHVGDLTRSGCEEAELPRVGAQVHGLAVGRSEEHTSELQSQSNLVCRLLLEKKNKIFQYSETVL